MKEKNIILHPAIDMIEWNNDWNKSCNLFMNKQGECIQQVIRHQELVACERTELKQNEPTLVTVKMKHTGINLNDLCPQQWYLEGVTTHDKAPRKFDVSMLVKCQTNKKASRLVLHKLVFS